MAEQSAVSRILRPLASTLWFPALFFFGFLLCYVLPFHAPTPHGVQVAVSGPALAGKLDAALEAKAPGAFDIIPVSGDAAARDAVTGQDAVAAYTMTGGDPTLYLAKAHGQALEQTVRSTFTPIAAQSGVPLHTEELVPTASGDVTGTGLFYLAMVFNIVPYIAVMMLMRAEAFTRRAKLAVLAGAGAFMSVVGYAIGLGMGIIPNQPLAILYAFMITQAVAWVTFGLVPFVRQYIPGVAIVLFVLLSIPSSGGAIPEHMVPAFFRWLHPVMPLGNLIDALRGIFYYDAGGLLRPTLVLCAWLLAGAGLLGAGTLVRKRQERRAAADAIDEVTEAPVEDPTFEPPLAHGAQPDEERPEEQHLMLVGRITEVDGTPVPGATVTITNMRGHQLMRTTTGRDGGYAATNLPEEFVTVLLSAPGRIPAATRVLPRSGTTARRDFVLPVRSADAQAVGR